MKKSNKKYLILSLVLLSLSFSAHAMEDVRKTLYAGMDYPKIFDQRKVLRKHSKTLKNEGLDGKKLIECYVIEEESTGVVRQILSNIFHALTCNNFRKRRPYEQYKKDDQYRLLSTIDSDEDSQAEIEINIENNQQINKQQTSDQLDKALVKDFRGKKNKALRKTLFLPIYCFFVDATFFGIAAKTGETDTGKGFGTIIMINVIRRNLIDFSKMGYCYFFPSGDPLDRFEERYAKLKRFLKPALQNAIERKFAGARKDDRSITEALDFSDRALNLPMKSKTFKFPTEKQFTKLLDGHEPPIKKDIELELFNHYSRFSKKACPLETQKTVLYFLGPPGTRKTYIVNQLEKLMNLPLIKLTIPSDNLEKIIGSTKEPGTFLEAISKPRMVRNAIIFIDEFDRVINKKDAPIQFFLQLLEPDEQYLYSPYLGANIDISHFCFIFAGNSKLESNSKINKEALGGRITIVKFEKVLTKRKKEIIKQRIGNMLPKNIKKDDAYSKLMLEINKCIEEDKNPGVRKLRSSVKNIINKFLLKKKREQEDK